MCQNYTYDVQTQVVSAFGGVSATDREVGSNHCPDEKGTERLGISKRDLVAGVATIAPMKRGLKVIAVKSGSALPSVATIAPMKRGLKVVVTSNSNLASFCSNHCPDEKGTESKAITNK